MLTTKARYLLELLEKVDIRGEEESFSVATLWRKLSNRSQDALTEVLEDLGFVGDLEALHKAEELISTIHLFQEGVYFVYDDALSFNRYRNITLRADFYDQADHILNPSAYRQWNRQKEKECLKAGIQAGNWHTKRVQAFFGPSDEPGDFYKRGSAAWKWRAFQAALLDAWFLEKRAAFFHLSPYEKILVQGQLMELGQIVDKRLRSHEQALLNVLCRKAGLNQRELEKEK